MTMVMVACGNGSQDSAALASPRLASNTATYGDAVTGAEVAAVDAPVDFILPSYSQEQLALLPDAPWGGERLAVDAIPAEILAAWTNADNGQWCAPLMLPGAQSVRAAALDGGWSLEVDQRGAPGVRANGQTCRRCGRSAFGIAGTSMAVDTLNDQETDQAPAPTFADGSIVQVEGEEEGVASATVTVGGQGCIYQVWTFLGEDHLRQLVEGLRIVAVQPAMDTAVANAR